MSKVASQYLQEVKKRIPCSGSQKTEFLCQLEAEVIYYCEDHDHVDLATLSKYFGNPEDVARDFLSELGINEVTKSNQFRKRLLHFVAIIIVLAIILFAAVEIHAYYTQQQFEDSYFIESIIYENESVLDVTTTCTVIEYYSEEEKTNK